MAGEASTGLPPVKLQLTIFCSSRTCIYMRAQRKEGCEDVLLANFLIVLLQKHATRISELLGLSKLLAS